MKQITWHKKTLEHLLDLGKVKDDFLNWDNAFPILESVVKHFSHLNIYLSLGHRKQGQLHGILMMVNDLKAKCDYDDIIDHLLKLGFKKTGASDYAELKRHTTELELNKIPVQVSGFFEGGSCEFVKVGVKEEPVYELKCSEVNQ